jgi:hypothetical protein
VSAVPIPLTIVPLEDGVEAALAALPASPGVGQILGPDGRNLVIGKPANLRRWAATHLGGGKPSKKGGRPPTDLRPIATAVAYAAATSPFHHRLLYERLMSRYVPSAKRRDLRPPAYLHLDPTERFPRLTIRGPEGAATALFGPFRNRQAAESARTALHKLHPLRPCDYAFEPDPALPLGLGCVYAQVKTCAAPCLSRVAEDDYRGLAGDVARLLAGPRDDTAGGSLPPWVARAEGSRALVVEARGDAAELYPVCEGSVLEESAVVATRETLDADVARLAWTGPRDGRDDRAWLSAWLNARRTGHYLFLHDVEQLASRVRGALGWDEPSAAVIT